MGSYFEHIRLELHGVLTAKNDKKSGSSGFTSRGTAVRNSTLDLDLRRKGLAVWPVPFGVADDEHMCPTSSCSKIDIRDKA